MAETLRTLKKVKPGIKTKAGKTPKLASAAERREKARKEMIKAQVKTQKEIKARVLAAGRTLDPRVMEMREIKERYHLRTIDLVGILHKNGYPISKPALSGVLQGNVRGTDHRNWSAVRDIDENFNHIDALLVEFKKIDFLMKVDCKRFLNRDMRSIVESWYKDLGITQGDKPRQLAAVLTTSYVTIYKWYRDNTFPKSMYYLIQIQKIVDDIKIEAALKQKYMEKAEKEKEVNRSLGQRFSTTRAVPSKRVTSKSIH